MHSAKKAPRPSSLQNRNERKNRKLKRNDKMLFRRNEKKRRRQHCNQLQSQSWRTKKQPSCNKKLTGRKSQWKYRNHWEMKLMKKRMKLRKENSNPTTATAATWKIIAGLKLYRKSRWVEIVVQNLNNLIRISFSFECHLRTSPVSSLETLPSH